MSLMVELKFFTRLYNDVDYLYNINSILSFYVFDLRTSYLETDGKTAKLSTRIFGESFYELGYLKQAQLKNHEDKLTLLKIKLKLTGSFQTAIVVSNLKNDT